MKILPESTSLPDIFENKNFNIVFTTQLDATEKFVKFEFSSDFPDYITETKTGYSGKLVNQFTLDKSSIKYRNNLSYGVADNFSEVPKNADIYSYIAPKVMTKVYTITVTAHYTKDELPEILKQQKVYKQTVRGDWSVFQKQFLEKVRK